MSLKLHSVINATTPDQEFVWLNTTEKVSLKGYAIVDRTFDAGGNISNEFRHIFVFPDLEIEKEDWVLLRTGAGTYRRTKASNGTGHIHHLYWQSDSCVWNDEGGDTATLIRFNVVNSKEVPAVAGS